MDHQYRENSTRNIHSHYNQMRAYVECSPNQSKKLYLIDFSHRAIDETSKIPEKCWPFPVPEFYQSIAVQLCQPTLIRWLLLLYVYK